MSANSSMADVITVEKATLYAQLVEFVVNHIGNGAFSTAAEPSEPNNTTRLAKKLFALLSSDRMKARLEAHLAGLGVDLTLVGH